MQAKKWFSRWVVFAGVACIATAIVLALAAGLIAPVIDQPDVVFDHPLDQVGASPVVSPGEMINPGVLPGSQPAGTPALSLSSDYYDFGSIASNAVVQRSFFVTNRGTGMLVIRRAYTTCGCTTASFSASIIAPGKSSRITITYNAGFHAVTSQTIRRGLVFESNDPDRPEAEIWVQATIR